MQELKFVEFCKGLKIPECQWKTRRVELMEWLNNFYDCEYELRGRVGYILIKEQFGEYEPMPRKKYTSERRQARLAEAKQDYAQYTKEALGEEYKPNSKSRVAKQAMAAFGREKYSHTNQEAVVRRFVKEPFEKYGQTNGVHVWVCYDDYKPMPEEVLAEWRSILEQEHISEKEAANAFYRQERGEDISKEKQYYRNALDRFREKYGYTPVLVREWRCGGDAE